MNEWIEQFIVVEMGPLNRFGKNGKWDGRLFWLWKRLGENAWRNRGVSVTMEILEAECVAMPYVVGLGSLAGVLLRENTTRENRVHIERS